jgi:hypothetical protein
MVYCAQGSFYGNPARWLYAEVYALKFRADGNAQTDKEADNG